MFFEILWSMCDFSAFFFDVLNCVGWCDDVIPDFGKSIHIEWHIINFAVIDGYRRIDEVIELGKSVDVLPHVFVVCVENVSTIFMDVDAADVFGVDITGDMIPTVNDQAGFALLGQLVSKYGTIKTCTDNQIIVHVVSP